MQTQISVVLGSYNRLPFLKAAIRSIRENGMRLPYEIIVVDGGSRDGSLAWLMRQKDILTILQHNHGHFHGKAIVPKSWGYFMNLGFKAASGTFLCMISDDSLLIPGAVMNGVDAILSAQQQGRSIGAAAFYWRNSWPQDELYMVSRTVNHLPFVNHGLYVRSALEEIGWLEENRYQFYCADIDVCLRLDQAGYEVIAVEDAFVEHYFHASWMRRESISPVKKQDEAAFVRTWTPAYHVLQDHPIVSSPLKKPYEDQTRTGYRLFPQWAIWRIQMILFLRKLAQYLKRKISGDRGEPAE